MSSGSISINPVEGGYTVCIIKLHAAEIKFTKISWNPGWSLSLRRDASCMRSSRSYVIRGRVRTRLSSGPAGRGNLWLYVIRTESGYFYILMTCCWLGGENILKGEGMQHGETAGGGLVVPSSRHAAQLGTIWARLVYVRTCCSRRSSSFSGVDWLVPQHSQCKIYIVVSCSMLLGCCVPAFFALTIYRSDTSLRR
jgi:hypothetical protein